MVLSSAFGDASTQAVERSAARADPDVPGPPDVPDARLSAGSASW